MKKLPLQIASLIIGVPTIFSIALYSDNKEYKEECRKELVAKQEYKNKLQILKTKDYDKYVKYLEKLTENNYTGNLTLDEANNYLTNEINKINDSLRIDSIVKTAYAKGINAVKKAK